MAQVSYGTITITDTNDIERIYTVYAKSANNTTVPAAAAANWKESISEAPGTGNYIWQRTVVQKSGTQEKTYSDPVCLTGEEGTDGRGITSITIKYGTSADWNTQPSSWYDNTPEYSSSTPNYWTQTTISYTSGSPTVKVTQDKALTQAIHDSVMANSLAQSANENANGAMGQAASNVNSIVRLWRAKSERSIPSAPTSEVTTGSASEYTNWSTIKPTATDTYRYFYYCDQSKTGGGVCTWSEVIEDTSYLSTYEINSLNVRTKNFFKGLDNSYDGWFASGRAENEGLVTNNAETYHYNARFAATHIALGYNKTPIIDLDGGSGAINIYRFPTINSNTGLVTTAGSLGMKLSATDLIFYKPPVGNNSPVAAATLNANGLVLSEGGLEAGTKNTTDYIYLYSKDEATNHTININNSGNKSDWRIVAGNKFGVDKAGNLYASNATISGAITVGSGSNVYTKTESDSNYDASGSANAAQAAAISAAATDATNKANNAAKTASNYLGDTDSNAGVTLKAQNGTTTANTSTSNYIKINTNGLEVFKSGESVALYGDTARIGKTNNSAFYINSNSLQAYYMNGNTRTLYFEVSPTGIKYGPSLNATVATTNQIPTTVASLSDASSYALKTYADDKANAAQAAAETTAQGYADTAEANASYSVEIQVTSIDYTNNSATLVAIPYYQGSTTLPTGVTLSYQWYKNGSALTNISTAPTITGATTNTLQLGEGTDFGSSTTNAIYTCVIS